MRYVVLALKHPSIDTDNNSLLKLVEKTSILGYMLDKELPFQCIIIYSFMLT